MNELSTSATAKSAEPIASSRQHQMRGEPAAAGPNQNASAAPKLQLS